MSLGVVGAHEKVSVCVLEEQGDYEYEEWGSHHGSCLDAGCSMSFKYERFFWPHEFRRKTELVLYRKIRRKRSFARRMMDHGMSDSNFILKTFGVEVVVVWATAPYSKQVIVLPLRMN